MGGILGFVCKIMRMSLSFFDLVILLGFWVFPGRSDRKWEALECVLKNFRRVFAGKIVGLGRGDREGV